MSLEGFCCSKTRQGYFKILRLTMKKRMRATLAAIRVELRRKLHEPVAKVGRWLKRVVQGLRRRSTTSHDMGAIQAPDWSIHSALPTTAPLPTAT